MASKNKRPMHCYTEESLKNALADIRTNLISISGDSKKYGVPRSTIQDRIHGRIAEGPRKMGPKTVLTSAEECRLVEWCHNLAKCGFPLKRSDLINTVQKIIQEESRDTPFVNGRPGKRWFSSFLKRHPSLALREAEGISKGRAVVTEESIRKWFADLKNFLIQENCLDILDDPSRVFNGDETSFSMCPKTGKVLAPKGYNNVYSIQRGNDKETLTVLLVFSADGKIINPMVVFPYKRPPREVVESLPEKWILGKSDSGWMVSETFFEYITNGVDSWLTENNVTRPILLFVDGHKSHMTMELSQFCSENEIILYALPPNTTHITQPADVSVFIPLKSEWKKTVREWQLKPENLNMTVSKVTFSPLLEMVLNNINLTDTIRNGFRKCGLYPFNPDNVDYTKCVKNKLEKLTACPNETNEGIIESDLDVAIRIIKNIGPKLIERGINPDHVIEEIDVLKNKEGDIEILGNVTIQSGTYILNEEGVLEMEPKSTEGPAEGIAETNHPFQPAECPSPIPVAFPQNHSTNPSTNPSPSSSIISRFFKTNSFKPISSSPISSETNIIRNEEILVSPTFEKHLYFPTTPSTSRCVKPKMPSAISALAWRNHYQSKENAKQYKADAIKKRKLDRENRKKENRPVKPKKAKQKQYCGSCNDVLDTDADDDELKNVGCDSCPKWFHLKCTGLKNVQYCDLVDIDFVCKSCGN